MIFYVGLCYYRLRNNRHYFLSKIHPRGTDTKNLDIAAIYWYEYVKVSARAVYFFVLSLSLYSDTFNDFMLKVLSSHLRGGSWVVSFDRPYIPLHFRIIFNFF
jgi:hypothetical protein